MIRDVGNIELCELLETEPKTQCKVCLSYWNIGIVYCTCGHFLRKGRRESEIHQVYDGPSFNSGVRHQERTTSRTSIWPGEDYTANQLKKKCKKKFFQGIHDRCIRDETFRNRMIENGRDEDVCRQWDVLADEDHTHHLTPQEYFYYKSNWWLTSNKTGSNTVPVEHRPDFKQALSTLQQLKQKKKKLNETNDGHTVLLLLHGGVGKVLGGLLIPMKVTMEMNQVLIEQGDLLYKCLEQVFRA